MKKLQKNTAKRVDVTVEFVDGRAPETVTLVRPATARGVMDARALYIGNPNTDNTKKREEEMRMGTCQAALVHACLSEEYSDWTADDVFAVLLDAQGHNGGPGTHTSELVFTAFDLLGFYDYRKSFTGLKSDEALPHLEDDKENP